MATTPPTPKAMTMDELIAFGLGQGIAQVKAVGSPLNPFLVLQDGTAIFLVLEPGREPAELALAALRTHGADAQRCVLVMDTTLTAMDGRRSDAIVVIAAERGQATGPMWVQRYRPRRLFRSFRVEGAAERAGEAKNLFDEAQRA